MARGKTYWTMLYRAWRLRCPRCGCERLFKSPFRMHEACAHCQLRYEREPGYFLGSIYINYGLTAVLATIAYFVLFFTEWIDGEAARWIVLAFAIVFPMWFFRYAQPVAGFRSLLGPG